jgi:hypothetical protein
MYQILFPDNSIVLPIESRVLTLGLRAIAPIVLAAESFFQQRQGFAESPVPTHSIIPGFINPVSWVRSGNKE